MDLVSRQAANYKIYIIVALVLLIIGLYIYYTRSSDTGLNLLTIYNAHRSKIPATVNPVLGNNAKAWIDINNTDQPALFVGKGANEADELWMEVDGKKINIMDQVPILSDAQAATYAALAVDVNHDGYTDLIVARDNGVTLYLNHGFGNFTKRKIVNKSDMTVPISLAVTDYNKDGHVDVYVSQKANPEYLARNPNYVAKDILLEGVGPGIFDDVTGLTKLNGTGNTLDAKWKDVNNDNLPDLILNKTNNQQAVYINHRPGSGQQFASGNTFTLQAGGGCIDNNQCSNIQNNNIQSSAPFPGQSWNVIDISNLNACQNKDLLLKDEPTKMTKQVIDLCSASTKSKDQKFQPKMFRHDNIITGVAGDIDFAWDSLTGEPNGDLPDKDLDAPYGGDLYWLNVKDSSRAKKDGKNWIGVKTPNSSPFLNSKVYVMSINDHTGEIRKQVKTFINKSNQNTRSDVLLFDLGYDTRVLRLDVVTIYNNKWTHPHPLINSIATFRNMHSNPYAPNF